MHVDLSSEAADAEAPWPARTVLTLLLSRHPGLVAMQELVRAIVQAPEEPRCSEAFVHDEIADLVGDGLAYRVDGRFVVASQAVVRARELLED